MIHISDQIGENEKVNKELTSWIYLEQQKEKEYLGILKWIIQIIIRETWGSNSCQLKNISCQVNTVQHDTMSSNSNNGQSNQSEDIQNWIVALNIDYLRILL